MYTCKTCKKIFSRKSNLENHSMKIFPCKLIETKPEIEEIIPEHNCEFCKKQFSTKFNLTKHLKGHCKQKKENELTKISEN
jgi:hypothetical protein